MVAPPRRVPALINQFPKSGTTGRRVGAPVEVLETDRMGAPLCSSIGRTAVLERDRERDRDR